MYIFGVAGIYKQYPSFGAKICSDICPRALSVPRSDRFPTAKLEESCELRGTDNIQGQTSEHIFKDKLRLLCLFSIGFKNWGISSDIPQFWLGNIRPRDAFRPIACERKYLLNYKS